MKKWLCITHLLLSCCAIGQVGFNKTFGFEPDFAGNAFMNVMLDHDTIVLFGSATPSNPPFIQGLLFVKMDTFGQVLLQRFHPDSDLDDYLADPNFDIIKTTDGGYALTGSNLLSGDGLFIKLNYHGDLSFYKKYPAPPNALKRNIRKVLETNNGFYLSGTVTYSDLSVFLMKVDLQGNFLWEKTFSQAGITVVMGSLVWIDNNRLAIGASKSKGLAEPPYQPSDTWTRSWLLEVDSLGNLLNAGESPLNVQSGIVGLNRLSDGWLYGTATFELQNQFEWGSRCKIVRCGENLNEVIWERVISPTSLAGNAMVDIKPAPNGAWIAVGGWATPVPQPPVLEPNYFGGATFQFTLSGDSIWSRLDTAFWHPLCGSSNQLGGVAILPGGSAVAAGYANSYCFEPERSYGWVLKIAPNGCIDTLCITTDLEITPPNISIRIYPNPTPGPIHIDACAECTVQVFDWQGRQVLTQSASDNYIDLSGLSDGVYVLKLFTPHFNAVQKVVKRRFH